MLAEERHRRIVEMTNSAGAVKVKELSGLFHVTEDCIRKDLAQLEKAELLKRTYGGAVPIRVNTHTFEVVRRKESNLEAKRKIAQKAIDLVQNGDTLFLDISTTNIEIAKEIIRAGKRVTIVTNMLDVIREFNGSESARLISIGGHLNTHCDGFIGSLSIQSITEYKFDLAFLGTVGMDVFDNSVYTYDAEDGMTKKAIIHSSRKTYLVAEVEKFNRDGNYKFASIDQFEAIITDEKTDEKIERTLAKSNVVLI
jgi:DeoR family glycerol-3-phosphate regulon repressor